jgi:hypothetical protein
MTQTIEKIRTIRIATLEKNTGIWIEKHIEAEREADEDAEIETQTSIRIGEIWMEPIKWKCPDCGHWNYCLQYVDPCGAMAVCEHCDSVNEF